MDHQKLFINAHKPELQGSPGDSEKVTYWLAFIGSLSHSNITKNFIDADELNLFEGVTNPATQVFVRWLAKSLHLNVTDIDDLKEKLKQGFLNFQRITNPDHRMIDNTVNSLFIYTNETIWGQEMLIPKLLLDNLNEQRFVELIDFWRIVFNLPSLRPEEIDELRTSILNIDWQPFCEEVTTRLQTPEFFRIIMLQHEARGIIKELSHEILNKQRDLITQHPQLTWQFLTVELMREFMQSFVNSLSGMDEDFLNDFSFHIFIAVREKILEAEKGLLFELTNDHPGDDFENNLILMECLTRLRNLLPELDSLEILPQPGEGKLAALTRKNNISAANLASEVGQEAFLWFARIQTFIEFWNAGHTDFNNLMAITGMSRKDFLHPSRPSVTRDCVGRRAVEGYFQFLFENYNLDLYEGESVLVQKTPTISCEN